MEIGILNTMPDHSCARGKVALIAHRGESADAPENTLAAFRLAYERGADAIELDTHLTLDHELVVCHDENTERTTGRSMEIRETPLCELQTLRAGAWKGEEWAEERLPTVREVVASLPGRTGCFIEMKVGPDAVAPLEKIVQDLPDKTGQIVVISFHAATIAETKRRLPQVRALLLSSFEQHAVHMTWTPTAQHLVELARSIGADGLGLHHEGPVDADFVEHVKSNGLSLYVWTVDDLDLARQMIEAGVDGLTTNKAGWLRRQLESIDGGILHS
jgi:glycerophosphoryl diester phosphodiesterase